MGFSIVYPYPEDRFIMQDLKSDRRLYLTEDQKTVVEEADKRSAFLLVGAGGTLDGQRAEELGLTADDKGKIVLPAETRALDGDGDKKGGGKKPAK
jgi:hypothetical protein